MFKHDALAAGFNNFHPFLTAESRKRVVARSRVLPNSSCQYREHRDKERTISEACAEIWTEHKRKKNGGDEGARTPDLSIANAALSQLSYIPTFFENCAFII
jgi:hypothetical protein